MLKQRTYFYKKKFSQPPVLSVFIYPKIKLKNKFQNRNAGCNVVYRFHNTLDGVSISFSVSYLSSYIRRTLSVLFQLKDNLHKSSLYFCCNIKPINFLLKIIKLATRVVEKKSCRCNKLPNN